MAGFRINLNDVKNKLMSNSCRDLIWFINILPTMAGFSFHNKKIDVRFWVVHTILFVYIYILSTVIYQVYYASQLIDTVNSFLYTTILILIINSSAWILIKRADLKLILELITKNDDLVKNTSAFLDKQRAALRQIKIVLIVYYVFHFINDYCIFIPTRVNGLQDFSIGTCYGLEPMTASPNREACILIVIVQELTSMVVVAGYDITLIFALAHTTAMFNILSKDIISLNNVNSFDLSTNQVSMRLKNCIIRHSYLLQTVYRIQETYSSAIGVGFGVNAVSLALFLFLPLDLWVDFAPMVYYSLCVFFLYCFQGQRLTTATERLEMAVYCCGWEKFNCKDQKLVSLMLKQSQKPVVLLAANVIPLRIHTFATTMQSIYRFFAVFKL